MNNLLKSAQDISTHIVHRKKLAEQKEIQKRNRKAQAYLDQVVNKLKKYNK